MHSQLILNNYYLVVKEETFIYQLIQTELMNKQRYAKIGIFHHDCWYTDTINKFSVDINEVAHRIVKHNKGIDIVSGTFRLVAPKRETDKAFTYIRNQSSVIEVKKISNEFAPMISVTWKTQGTAFDHIMKSDCPYVSPVYSTNGYETFDIIANDFIQMQKAVANAEDVGEVKIFSISNSVGQVPILTRQQLDALIFAYSQGYYEWPKKANLEQVARLFGKKRRTFQENLRRAESKFIPLALQEFLKKL